MEIRIYTGELARIERLESRFTYETRQLSNDESDAMNTYVKALAANEVFANATTWKDRENGGRKRALSDDPDLDERLVERAVSIRFGEQRDLSLVHLRERAPLSSLSERELGSVGFARYFLNVR